VYWDMKNYGPLGRNNVRSGPRGQKKRPKEHKSYSYVRNKGEKENQGKEAQDVKVLEQEKKGKNGRHKGNRHQEFKVTVKTGKGKRDPGIRIKLSEGGIHDPGPLAEQRVFLRQTLVRSRFLIQNCST